MANNENLKPFKKGDPRINSTGLNKGYKHITASYNKMLAMNIDKIRISSGQKELVKEFGLKTVKDLMVCQMVATANHSDDEKVRISAMKEITDRVEGKAIQTIDASIEATELTEGEKGEIDEGFNSGIIEEVEAKLKEAKKLLEGE